MCVCVYIYIYIYIRTFIGGNKTYPLYNVKLIPLTAAIRSIPIARVLSYDYLYGVSNATTY